MQCCTFHVVRYYLVRTGSAEDLAAAKTSPSESVANSDGGADGAGRGCCANGKPSSPAPPPPPVPFSSKNLRVMVATEPTRGCAGCHAVRGMPCGVLYLTTCHVV